MFTHKKLKFFRVVEVLFGTELYRRRKQNPPFIISLDPYSLGCFFAAVSSSVLRSVPESGGCQNSSILRCWRLQDWKLNEIMWKIGLVERGEGVGGYHSLRSRVWSSSSSSSSQGNTAAGSSKKFLTKNQDKL